MTFVIKPYKELVLMTKEKIEEVMVPLRIRSAKSRAEAERIKLEEKLITLETRINEESAKKEVSFTAIADLLDDYDLTERRLKQINTIVEQMFPERD